MFVRITASVRAALFLIVVILLPACGGRSDIVVSSEEKALRDDVLATLASADDSEFRSSFERIPGYAFNRYIRTEQYDDQDYMVAFDEYLVRTEGSADQRHSYVERTDSAGSFDFGFFSRFVSENVESVDPVNLIPYVIPDDFSYTDPRNVDKYRFRFLPDTLLWDREARAVEIRAKPESGDGLNVRLIRQFIDLETNKLIAVYLERIDLALLFREESTFYVDTRPGPDNSLLPYNTRFQTNIKTPFRGSYKIRTVSTFSSYQRP